MVSVFDHGFLYGDGVYETLRTYGGKVWQLEKHLKRLRLSAGLLRLSVPWSDRQMTLWLEKLLRLNRNSESRIRMTLSRGVNGGEFYSCVKPTLLMVARPLKEQSDSAYSKGVKAITVRWQRILPEAKSISLLPFILSQQQLHDERAYEALYVDGHGYLTEGTVTNVFLIRRGVLVTSGVHVLGGTTRDVIFSLAKKLKIPVRKRPVKVRELLTADEVFVTNAPRGIIPVVQIDKKKVGNGKVGSMTRQFRVAFMEYVSAITASR